MTALRQLVSRFTPRLGRNQYGPIGVELSLTRLHMVQLYRNSQDEIHVHARVSVPYADGRDELLSSPVALKRLVRRGLTTGGFNGRRAVLGMPGGTFRTMPINYPQQSKIPDDQLILKLMTERLDGDISDYVIDYIPVRAQVRDAEKLAIVAVSSRQQVVEFLDSMRAAGLSVDSLEISPVAIRRLINSLPTSSSDMMLILNTGVNKSYLTMLSGRRLLMDKAIDFCETRLLATLAKALDMTEDSAKEMVLRSGIHPQSGNAAGGHCIGETGIFNTFLEILKPEFLRLTEETDRAFMYAAAQMRGGGNARVYLFGSLARWQGADRVLADFLHLPIANLQNPLFPFGDQQSDAAQGAAMAEPEFAVASGLALKSLINE